MSAFVASMAIIRMKRNNIIGKDISKCFDSSKIKTIYFDKTGTLTES
jgi:magnesium-transporting ATPase (P-type)